MNIDPFSRLARGNGPEPNRMAATVSNWRRSSLLISKASVASNRFADAIALSRAPSGSRIRTVAPRRYRRAVSPTGFAKPAAALRADRPSSGMPNRVGSFQTSARLPRAPRANSCSSEESAQCRSGPNSAGTLTRSLPAAGNDVYSAPRSVGIRDVPQLWPPPHDNAAGQVEYRCELTNAGDVVLDHVSLDLNVVYRSPNRETTGRTAILNTIEPLQPKETFTFRVFDDTKWDPVVALSDSASTRLRGERESRTTTVQYSTADGRPLRIAGFGIPPSP